MSKKRAEFWTRYSTLGASSRLRFEQFVPYLQEYGWDISQHGFFDDAYLKNLYAGKKRSIPQISKYYASRICQMYRSACGTPAVIEYELLPFLPFVFERAFLKKHPYILNFDDAVDLHYENSLFLKNKYPQLISGASGIITANDMLAEKFSRYNKNILKLPTIPPACIKPGTDKPYRLTVIWTGTPVTYKFLMERSQALLKAAEKIDFELIVVAKKDLPPLPGVECRMVDWSEKVEAELLARSHIGIMPLPDTAFARGKSAYKLICYLRAGIPGIASPVGENCKVIQEGENGFFAASDEQWIGALTALADAELREKMSINAANSARAFLPETSAIELERFMSRTFFA